MQTDRTTKAMVGIVAFLSLGSTQAGMALQEGSIVCSASSLEACRVQAEAGDAFAQSVLGHAYDLGEGVPEDDAEAVRWYRLAVEQGDALAQFNLGLRYANGEGVDQNDARAYLWLNIAATASQGDINHALIEARDRVADRLSLTDRVAAQRLEAQCQASGFQNCGKPE
jgi:TPR repeat protein